jgi:hypothetical protein
VPPQQAFGLEPGERRVEAFGDAGDGAGLAQRGETSALVVGGAAACALKLECEASGSG